MKKTSSKLFVVPYIDVYKRQALSNQEAIHPMVGRLFHQDFLGLARKGNLREDKKGLLGSRSQYQLVSLAVEGLVKEELVNGLS